MILSVSMPAEAFERQAAGPYVDEAEIRIDAGDFDGALGVMDRGRQRLPDNRLIQVGEAVCLAAAGDHDGARARLEALRAVEQLPQSIEAEALHAAARMVLEGDDSALLPQAQRACEAALDLTAQPEHLLTLGRVQLQLGRIERAREHLMMAYKATSSPDREDRCLAYLALAAHRAGDAQEALLFQDALRRRRPGARLLALVDRGLAPHAATDHPTG
jgi:tetratricopeptide (TPR) repeat protein